MKLTKEESDKYHSHTIRNMEGIKHSQICGCMACCSIYNADQIEDWIEENGEHKKTALCVKCGIDAVIGDSSGLEINQEILKVLNKIWF